MPGRTSALLPATEVNVNSNGNIPLQVVVPGKN
jgi:hypothetical protein